MSSVAEPIWIDTRTIERLPRWITHLQDETSETVALLSGAALMMSDNAVRDPGGTLPGALLRDRPALKVAVACLKLEGRSETAPDIRDAVCLVRPVRLGQAGDASEPASDMLVS